ncbi:MAG TPA: TIGR03364 family FAD-dependent oxidoreductase [Chthonomonadaceae bacterium]|nr:TIGR03364 family FAD-dependent oxidoreductase [Chthonomonadaceae bacterium]
MAETFDAAVVGAGILGLVHAYHLAKRGLRVAVFERNPQAMGASIRNFGMLWPIGQPPGARHRLALRSREIWQGVLQESGLWHDPVGSLHLAYREDEAQVLREFVAAAPEQGYDVALLTPEEVCARSTLLRPEGLLCGMESKTEICVDPPSVIAGLPAYLQANYGVTFVFNTAVIGYESPTLLAGGREWRVERLFVCSGDDLQTLYPGVLQQAGLSRCKLQMLRSAPVSARLGPMPAAGLTLRHYQSFAHCPSLAELKRRVATETPEYDRYGVHVMASQNGRGELVLGDSHEYDADITPFDKPEIDDLILDYLNTFLAVPDLRIAARWHGIYVKHPTEPYLVTHPAPNVTLTTSVGGAGMTLSFGLAEQVVNATL